MMPLTLPGACSAQLVDDVVAEREDGRNAAFFAGLAVEWRQRVEFYLEHGGSPEHVPTWPAIADVKAHRNSFLNLYSHPKEGSAHGVVLDALRAHELDICPACGEKGVPNTLDHYLPKRTFPQFAISPANLFPMCDACQGAKWEKTGDAAAPRYFIHPYFDTFSRPQIVALTIAGPLATPTFTLAPHPELGGPEQILVGTHLRELEIHERYIRFFRNEHRRLLRSVARLRGSGQNVVAQLTEFAARSADPTPNSWEHLFYDGVLANPALLIDLVEGALPPLP